MSRLLSALLIVALLSGSIAQAAEDDRHVILIAIDGLPAYLLNDPLAPLPTLRKLAREGTVGQGMRPSNPSVTWPNHTTLTTGVRPAKHSVLFNGVLVRKGPNVIVTVDPNRDKAELVAVPTLFDLFSSAGLKTAGINWPCTRNAPSVHDNFPDVPDQILHMTSTLREELLAIGSLPDATQKSWRAMSSAGHDQVWSDAATLVLRKRKPNFMAYHILVTDGTHHKYGPQTPAGYVAVGMADLMVREVMRAIEDAGIKDKTSIFIVSDHGFNSATKLMQPNLLFKKAGLLKADLLRTVSARVQSVSEGGTAMVYFTDPATYAEDRQVVLGLLKDQEGLADIIEPDRFDSFGYPDPTRNPQMANMVLVAKDGYAFANTTLGNDFVIPVVPGGPNSLGYHGYISTNPRMNTVFIAWGRGIKPGGKIGVIDNTDVAPTIAHLLGKSIENADGKVLTEVLKDEKN